MSKSILYLLLAAAAARSQVNPPGQTDRAAAAAEIKELRAMMQTMQARLDRLDSQLNSSQAAAEAVAASPPPPTPASPAGPTVNLYLDGYYGWNFNQPIGRANLLRAYDVSSNSFSLNQAALVLEAAPDPANGRRFGGRVDLQWGQATQTLQGNAANEPRPDIYRAVFQAYGTYVIPAGRGLTVDLGKWASSLGIEGNYTKDQMNYSRSYWFNYLPFYHMGIRANYRFSDGMAASYWIVNGTQQTEAFNDFKDQLFGLALTPRKNLSVNLNYYLGQDHPNVLFYPSGGAPAGAPEQQGVPFEPIPNAPEGRLHIFDTYATWQTTPKLTLAGEGDYVIERLQTNSAPALTWGGALYGRYQLTSAVALGARTE